MTANDSGAAERAPHEQRVLAALAHLSILLLPVVGPVLVMLLNRTRSEPPPSAYVDAQSREAFNFQLTLFIAGAALMVIVFPLAFGSMFQMMSHAHAGAAPGGMGGFITAWGLGVLGALIMTVLWTVLPLVAAIRVMDGADYRYPFAIRLLSVLSSR